MNRDRLNKLIDIYIDNFDIINDEAHFENMKWEAIYHYKNNFDINAPDFYEMFKYAMSKSDIIINNGTVQPINGILKLISHEEDTMRNLFAMLYEEDGGDIAKRQDRIERFVDEANKLLDKYERGKWKFKQNFRSVLAYLVFYKPEENYLYKSNQCQPFFRYLEYGEEIGYGQYFKLSRYYNMCDEIREALSQHPELMETHKRRWKTVGDPGDNLRILTFDIIYCSIVYNYYDHQNFTKIVRKSKATYEQEKLEAEIEKKHLEIEALEVELEATRQILDEIPEILIEGKFIKHKTLGVGQVVKQNGSFIVVSFTERSAKFILTQAFATGLLTSDDSSIIEQCKKTETCLSVCQKIELAIKIKLSEINFLNTKITK